MISFKALLVEMPWVNPSISGAGENRHAEPTPIKNERYKDTKPRKVGKFNDKYSVYKHELPSNDDGTPTGYHLVNNTTKNSEMAVHGVTRDGKFFVHGLKGKGADVKAHEFYHHLVTKQGVHLHSDYEQSEGGMKVWKRLQQMAGVHVQSYNGSSQTYHELKPSFQRKYDMDSSTRLAAKSTLKEGRMISFIEFLLEDKSQKTLDWLKNHYEHKERPSSDSAYSAFARSDTSMNAAMHARAGNSLNWMHNKTRDDQPFNPLHHAIDHIALMDPHPDKAHTQWLAHNYASGKFRAEDRPRIKETMQKFMDNKKKLGNTTVPSSGKRGSDINSFRDIHELETHLDFHFGEKKETKGEYSHPDAPLIHDKDGIKVHQLTTKEASIHTRKCFDNKWCTARDDEHNMHDDYDQQGPLYHVQTPDKKHWQFHFPSGSFADHTDQMHDPHDLVRQYPGLTDVKEFRKQKLEHALFFTKNRDERDAMIKDHFTHPILKHELDDDDVTAAVERGSKAVHQHIVAHPHVAMHHIQDLAWHADEKVSHAILDHLDKNKDEISNENYYDTVDTLARHKHPSVNKRMAESPDQHTRAAVATHDHTHRDKMIRDPSNVVRNAIAVVGEHAHRDVLVDDEHPLVRANVARHGLDRHRQALLDDPHPAVQQGIAETSSQMRHLSHIYLHSPDEHARKIAKRRLDNDRGLKP